MTIIPFCRGISFEVEEYAPTDYSKFMPVDSTAVQLVRPLEPTGSFEANQPSGPIRVRKKKIRKNKNEKLIIYIKIRSVSQ
jgi:hypothetical protein